MTRSVVDDQGVRDPGIGEFPRCQRRALVPRPRLAHPDVDVDTLRVRQVHRGRGGPEFDARKSTGIAVRHHLHLAPGLLRPLTDEVEASSADPAALIHVLVGERDREGTERRLAIAVIQFAGDVQTALERPPQVDRSRASSGKEVRRTVQRAE